MSGIARRTLRALAARGPHVDAGPGAGESCSSLDGVESRDDGGLLIFGELLAAALGAHPNVSRRGSATTMFQLRMVGVVPANVEPGFANRAHDLLDCTLWNIEDDLHAALHGLEVRHRHVHIMRAGQQIGAIGGQRRDSGLSATRADGRDAQRMI